MTIEQTRKAIIKAKNDAKTFDESNAAIDSILKQFAEGVRDEAAGICDKHEPMYDEALIRNVERVTAQKIATKIRNMEIK